MTAQAIPEGHQPALKRSLARESSSWGYRGGRGGSAAWARARQRGRLPLGWLERVEHEGELVGYRLSSWAFAAHSLQTLIENAQASTN